MLAIRLQRMGRKKQPVYRVVVSEKAKDMYGNHLEILGQYNPHKKEAVLKEDRIKYWISKGAQASSSVNNLLIKEGLVEGAKTKAVRITKKRAAKQEAKEAEGKKEEAPKEAAPAEGDTPKTEETKEAAPAEKIEDKK
jgi:small subunit ribosomal protein S16